jgi:hypothetical protein
MARKGPTTVFPQAAEAGLAQIRVGPSASNITKTGKALTADNSIGAMASTKVGSNTEWLRLMSGFPELEDYAVVTQETAYLECAFREITPYTLSLAAGLDPTAQTYKATSASYQSGEVALGGRSAPVYIRVEAEYTYPNGTKYMTVIYPRAQATASIELDWSNSEWAACPLRLEAKRADGEIDGGDNVWNAAPLGHIIWT